MSTDPSSPKLWRNPHIMADRFPSIEDLSEGNCYMLSCPYPSILSSKKTTQLTLLPYPTENATIPDGAPENEQNFLDRERAALGDDADQFATPGDNLATSGTVADGEDDLLGGDFSGPPTAGSGVQDQEISGFESSFPAIDNRNEQIGLGGTITGPSAPQPSYSSYAIPSEEPEVIKYVHPPLTPASCHPQKRNLQPWLTFLPF